MTEETFKKVEPKEDEYCKVVYLHKGKKFETEMFYGKKYDDGTVMFHEKNWSGDCLPVKLSRLLYVKPIT